VTREDEREEFERSERLYRRSVEKVASTPWAIELGALATIKAILAERASGHRLSDEEIQERIGLRSEEDPPAAAPVAVLRLRGPIVPHAGMMSATSAPLQSVEGLRADFRDALASDDVKAILFDIDSPGGAVDLIPELGAEIRAARGEKPIVAIANTIAASAAYWIGAQADEFVVTPSGMVGSVGVYSAHDDISGMQEKLGVDTTLISAGKYKVEANPFEPLSDEAKEYMQSVVDEYYGMFVAAVAKGRGVSTAVVRDDFGQGRLVMPSKALEAGMVDAVATYDETLARLTKSATATRSQQDTEPEPPAATTPFEPEPSEATTRTPRFRNQEEWLEWISKS
jgi:signal peptide peptidase SppA